MCKKLAEAKEYPKFCGIVLKKIAFTYLFLYFFHFYFLIHIFSLFFNGIILKYFLEHCEHRFKQIYSKGNHISCTLIFLYQLFSSYKKIVKYKLQPIQKKLLNNDMT